MFALATQIDIIACALSNPTHMGTLF